MDVLEIFLNQISYKFPKGYPDINNKSDIILLENIISEYLDVDFKLNEDMKKDYTSLSPEAQKVAKFISKKLNIDLDDIKSLTRNKIIILSDDRKKIFDELNKLGYKYDSNMAGSSQGGYKVENGIDILVKPKKGQGNQSAGKQNEASFFDLINNHVEQNDGPITVILKSTDKKLKFKNVEQCVDSSAQGATEFQKADAQFLDSKGKVLANISLKKRNAVRWESSKRRLIGGIDVFKTFIEKALNKKFPNVILKPIEGKKDKYKLFNPKTNQVLSKVVLINTPEDVIDDVVFGNDNPSTIVVKETFENFSNYTFENGILTINCYKIYTDVEDIIGTQDEPIFAMSNHIGQAHGIEFRSFSKGLLYKDEDLKGSSTEIDFNKLK